MNATAHALRANHRLIRNAPAAFHLKNAGHWRFLLRAVLLFGAGLLGISSGWADPPGIQFYVSPSGNDAANGTIGHPFATLTRAQQAVRATNMTSDVIINLRAGTHTLSGPLSLSDAAGDSGRNGFKVIYQPYGYGTAHQETAVVSGGRQITGWILKPGSSTIWQASVGNLNTRQLFVNGQRATMTSIAAPAFTLTPTGYVTTSAAPQSWANPADIEFVYKGAFHWSEPRCGVASITGTPLATVITMDQPCFRYATEIYSALVLDTGHVLGAGLAPTSIENSPSFLTEPGTFYLDRSAPGAHVLYYIPRPGENLQQASVVAPELERLITTEGSAGTVHDVTFRGLTFSYATWLHPSTTSGFVHYISGDYENGDGAVWPVTYSDQARGIPGHLAFINADRILLERNRFERLGGTAVEVIGSENVIRGNVFTDISSGGILIGDDRPRNEMVDLFSADNRIENNWFHHLGVQYHGGTAIHSMGTLNLTIAHNQINDMPYGAIFITGATNTTIDPSGSISTRGLRIQNNLAFNLLNVLSDSGGIYTNAPQGDSYANGTVISGNVVRDLINEINFAIYSDWGASWQTIDRNVVFRCQTSAGGLSVPLVGQADNITYSNNFWIGEPAWVGVPPTNMVSINNTALPTTDPEGACQGIPECAAILDSAGLQPAYQDLIAN